MTLRLSSFLALIVLFASFLSVPAQVSTAIGQFTSSGAESFAGGTSGDGRFVVFESRGNLATVNPRNADGNVEIFLWDYAQRRIFQITNTKSVLVNPAAGTTAANIRVEITNKRPVISNDGRWIAFSSNATAAYPGSTNNPPVISSTNPGDFDGNVLGPNPTPTPFIVTPPPATPTPSPTPTPSVTPTPVPNALTQDANLEIWLYQIPAYAPVADLSTGEELPLTDLSGGVFTQVTNSLPSVFPRPASTTSGAFVADDNHDPSINDDGNFIAFASTRDLVPTVGNIFPDNDNDEIFTYSRGSGMIGQVTVTPRGSIANPIYNKNPTISGNGSRVAFASTGENPIDNPASTTNFVTGVNPAASRNEEIFYADLAGGVPTGGLQVTTTTPLNPGDPVNILDLGKRMSRDGRYIAFDSYADLAGAGGPNQTSFALYVYDNNAATPAARFRQVGPRSNADAGAQGGDVQHYPGFTDNDANGTPSTLLLETRLNIKADGTIAATAADGLNPEAARPTQIYSYTLNQAPAAATFTRLTKFPISTTFLASTQPLPSDTARRFSFNLALTELGTGNFDLQTEAYYLLQPLANAEAATTLALNYFTGASRLPIYSVAPSPTPTPSPTATPTPTPTPTPSPSPSPSGSPTPVPTPTPVTPPAVLGVSPGMLAIVTYDPAGTPAITARTAVGSLDRSFTLPIQLSGVTMTINGIAVGLKSVSTGEIVFVAPPAISSVLAGTVYPVVININGTEIKRNLTIVPARPDIFTNLPTPGPLGRALATNVTNRVPTTEPFTVKSIKIKGGVKVPTVLRLRMTGIANTTSAVFTIRIGSVSITGSQVLTGGILVEPGVYTVDFTLPAGLDMAGDQPVVVTITADGTTFISRLDDTAPRLSFL